MDDPISHPTGGATVLRRITCIVLLAAVAVVPGHFASTSAQGQGSPLDAQRAQIRQLEEGLMEIDAQSSQANQAWHEAQAREKELKERIARNQQARKVARQRMGAAQDRLEERLVAIYVQSSPNTMEMLISAGSLTDAVDNLELLRRVERQDQEILRDAVEHRERVDQLRTELLADQKETVKTRRELEARVQHLQGLAAQRQRLLGEARTVLISMEAAERRRQEQAAAAQAAAQAAAVQRAQRQAGDVASGRTPATTPSAPRAADPPTAPAAQPSAPSSGSAPSSHLQQIAQCESGGNPSAVSPGGTYRGKYQFHPDTWRSVGGRGDPASAPEAEQDRRASILYNRTGPSSWPVCGAR